MKDVKTKLEVVMKNTLSNFGTSWIPTFGNCQYGLDSIILLLPSRLLGKEW